MKSIPVAGNNSSLILNLHSILRPLDFMEKYNKQYGDFYRFIEKKNLSINITSNPQAIREILTMDSDVFDSGKANKSLSFLLGDNSLILLDGKDHKSRRRLLMPYFHGKFLEQCSQKIISITNQVSDRLEVNQPFVVRPLMQEITLKVMLNLVFGIDSEQQCQRLSNLLVELLEIFNSPFKSLLIFFPILQKDWGKYSPWGNFLSLKAEIKKLIYQKIKERQKLLIKEKSKCQDIFGLLILAKDENGAGMTDEEVHDELITLLFAGHETTASALSWLFYWIHYHSEIEDKLRLETSLLGNVSDYQTINNLSYLNALIFETLRIYPVVVGSFARIPNQDTYIMGYKINKNDYLSISIYNLHHREDLYPNSKQFKPERFLETTYSPYEYLPFGGGNRRCLGSALALLEMKLVTVTILKRFKLVLTNNHSLYPVRRGITLSPPASFRMTVKNCVLGKNS